MLCSVRNGEPMMRSNGESAMAARSLKESGENCWRWLVAGRVSNKVWI